MRRSGTSRGENKAKRRKKCNSGNAKEPEDVVLAMSAGQSLANSIALEEMEKDHTKEEV